MAADLWRALEEASGRPVARIAQAWIAQAGTPLAGVLLLTAFAAGQVLPLLLAGTAAASNNTNGFDDGDGIRSGELQTWFGREGILNAKPYELRNRLFVSDFKEGQYAEVFRNRSDAGYADIEVLAVGFSSDASGKRQNGLAWPNNRTDHPVPSNKGLNPWRYVSTNPTNNSGGFDLWAEIPVGRERVKIIGNWKESN